MGRTLGSVFAMARKGSVPVGGSALLSATLAHRHRLRGNAVSLF